MHLHWFRRVRVYGPYAGNRYGTTGWIEEQCRCGLKQTWRGSVNPREIS